MTRKIIDTVKTVIEKLRYYKSEFLYKRGIIKIYKNLHLKRYSISKEALTDHRNYWKQLKRKVGTKWYEVYSHTTNNTDIHFVPDNIYHNVIEASLNNRSVAFSYRDKNFYELYYEDKNIFPECIMRNIEKFFYSKDYEFLDINDESLNNYLKNYSKIIVKPATESSGGRNISLFTKTNGKFINEKNQILTLNFLKKIYVKNFIIQNWIQQDSYFSMLNSTSVNSVRICTYRSVNTDEIIILITVLRIGKKGSYIDNQTHGGIACNINENSRLDKYAYDQYGNRFSESNGISFENIKEVPKLEEMKEIAKSIAVKNFYSRLMGFDFCVDINGKVKLIEINNQYASISFQMNSGPFFGKYTDEVVEYCKLLHSKHI